MSSLQVDEVLGDVHDVLEVDHPAADHLERQAQHEDQQGEDDGETHLVHLLVKRLEHGLRQQQRRKEADRGN